MCLPGYHLSLARQEYPAVKIVLSIPRQLEHETLQEDSLGRKLENGPHVTLSEAPSAKLFIAALKCKRTSDTAFNVNSMNQR